MTDVEVQLPPGWYPLAPVPGALLAAAAVDKSGRAVATLVVCMQRCEGVLYPEDAELVAATLADDPQGARAIRWCDRDTVAVLAARAAPGAPVSREDLRAALDQTAVYAVASTGSAIRSSSAADANASCRGSTRTV